MEAEFIPNHTLERYRARNSTRGNGLTRRASVVARNGFWRIRSWARHGVIARCRGVEAGAVNPPALEAAPEIDTPEEVGWEGGSSQTGEEKRNREGRWNESKKED